MQTFQSSGAITGMEGTCWSPTIWSQMSLHRRILKKTVIDPGPAPYQNSNDYRYFTYDQKRSGTNLHQTSVINTVQHQWILQGRQSRNKSQVLLQMASKAASFLRWRIIPFNDVSSHLLTHW